jgi:hypothetical protein
MSIITVDYQNTVLYDGRRPADRIIAAAIDEAIRIDVQYVKEAADLQDLLMPHDITPVLIGLSPITCISRADMEKIAQRGYNVLYFAVSSANAHENIGVLGDTGALEDANIDPHTDVGVRMWVPPALPIAISAGASLLMISLAHTYDGYVIGKVPPEHGKAFVSDLTGGGLSPDEQIRLCFDMSQSFSGMDAVSVMLRRGVGRLAERHAVLSALVQIGASFPRNPYEDDMATIAAGHGARLSVLQDRVLVVDLLRADAASDALPADACIP